MAESEAKRANEIRGTTEALNHFTRRLLAVPHGAIKAKLVAEKAVKRTSKRSSSHVSVSRPKTGNLEGFWTRSLHLAGQFYVSQSLP